MKSERSRDESVEHLLRRHGRAGATPADACLDAEVVAAWLAGGLARHELEAVQAHAASCARCQAIVAAAAGIEPVAVPHIPWWSVLKVQWLIPITAAAAAAALWFYVTPARPGPASVQMARVDQTSPSPAPSPSNVPAPASPVRQLSKTESGREKAQVPPPSAANAIEQRAREQKPSVLQDAAKSARAEAAPAAAAPSPAPASPTTLQAPAGLAESVNVRFEVVSPDPARRWRPAGRGLVERSTDGGRTWVRQDVPTAAEITAGSSPSGDVCWLAGRSGVVALSTDGRTWTLRPLAEAIDIAAIHATDATSAEATTYDGRRFTTRDAGVTWSHPPLQESPAVPF